MKTLEIANWEVKELTIQEMTEIQGGANPAGAPQNDTGYLGRREIMSVSGNLRIDHDPRTRNEYHHY